MVGLSAPILWTALGTFLSHNSDSKVDHHHTITVTIKRFYSDHQQKLRGLLGNEPVIHICWELLHFPGS